ncbi:hypothetical protein BDZ97DRAFT_1626317, partial [Flammula alnicola]
IIDMITGRSKYFSHSQKIFPLIVKNSDFAGMLAWLDSNGTLPSEEIWHVEKAVYTINDLKAWVDNGGTLDPKSKRAKEKGKGKEKQKGISHKKGSTSRKHIMTHINPVAAVGSDQNPFPDILFQSFAEFVAENFSSKVSLSTVLLVLFSMTDNPDLLNLHARQKHPRTSDERKSVLNGWIKSLSRAIQLKLNDKALELFKDDEKSKATLLQEDLTSPLALKIDKLADALDLTPYREDRLRTKLKPISYDAIKGVRLICPPSMQCSTLQCGKHNIAQYTKTRDIPKVTLIEGTTIHENAMVLTGECSKCKTLYMADHETAVLPHSTDKTRVYLNNAKFLKVGANLWVDRVFSAAVINGMYSFHASAAAYTEFWNNSFGRKTTRRQIWDAFVQESVRTISSVSQIDFETADNLDIESLTETAYDILGEEGLIRVADGHECSECTQPYKATADIILDAGLNNNDPAAMANNDEGRQVPPLAVNHINPVPQTEEEIDEEQADNTMAVDHAPVKMVVLDGIVMGPTHCAFENCSSDLNNARGGAFCNFHELDFGRRCRHQPEWRKYTQDHSRSTLSGVRRVLKRPNENIQPWQQPLQRNVQPHDENAEERPKKNYFGPSRFYCVETICAPCGVVIAWTKFVKAESPTNILEFLERVYPTEESRPDYVCIDKACLVLARAISLKKWDSWQKTTRMVVDSYHYINHRVTDFLCRKWCNPAPLDGSAPNLVVKDTDKNGREYFKRAFNTQACEHLNSWLGGYDSILKRMKGKNFNWFLHVMIFHHTKL